MSVGMRTLRRSRDAGFTMIEMVIGLLVMGVIAGTLTDAAISTYTAHTRMQHTRALQTAAEATWEAIVADPAWKSACADDCTAAEMQQLLDLGSIPALRDDAIPGLTFAANVTATADDLPADGTGVNDLNGAPDRLFLELTLSLEPAASGGELSKRPLAAPVTIDGYVEAHPGERHGLLVVYACRVTNQVDERMRIGGCDGEAAFRMEAPAPSSAVGANDRMMADGTAWTAVLRAMYPTVPVAQLSAQETRQTCPTDKTAGWLRMAGAVCIESYSATVTVSGTTAAGRSYTRSFAAPQGKLVKPVPFGVYTVEVTGPGSGYHEWSSHWFPAKGTPIHIAREGETRVMRIYQPAYQTVKNIRAKRLDTSRPWAPEWPEEWKPKRDEEIMLRPFPEGRAEMPGYDPVTKNFGGFNKWGRIKEGEADVDFPAVPPGLYSAWIWTHNSQNKLTRNRGFVRETNGNFGLVAFVYVGLEGNAKFAAANGTQVDGSDARVALPYCNMEAREQVFQSKGVKPFEWFQVPAKPHPFGFASPGTQSSPAVKGTGGTWYKIGDCDGAGTEIGTDEGSGV